VTLELKEFHDMSVTTVKDTPALHTSRQD